ncbi:sulfotransferase [Marinibacterium sp. SX1]|uniref:sulfotransferase n=1 Tax=Marinibacterium sp. SX1 TaxID=3388424 RepID=UPI003D17165C
MTIPDWPVHRITGRNKQNLSAPSALRNFTFDPEPLAPGAGDGLVFTPYALDPELRAVVEVGMPRVPPARPRAFFYMDQFHDAEMLRLAPVDDYAAGIAPALAAPQETPEEGADEGPERIFVFSIGRAGSTLVSQILGAAGIASLSEPDVLLDLGQRKRLAAFDPAPADWDALYRASLDALEAAFGRPAQLAVKFRAQSSNLFHVRAMLRLYPRARYVFLFREAEPWSLSFTRKFGFQAETLKWLMTENLKAATHARKAGADVRIVDYADIVRAPDRLLAGLVRPEAIAAAAPVLQEVMQRDSQHGLFDRPKQDAVPPEHARFMDWWQNDRPRAMLEQLGLKL